MEPVLESSDEGGNQMTPAIQAMRDWLRTCPLVASAQEDGVAFRVGGLTGDAEEYTILDMPGAPELKRYFSGSLRLKNYVLASHTIYTPDNISQQAAASGFWDDLTEWVASQNRARNFPQLGSGRTVREVSVTSSGYILEAEGGACRAQIQLQLIYYQPKGATT
jgi:hypothetical protein